MYPRLQAEEALHDVSVAGAGNPLGDAQARKNIVAAWQAQLPRRAPQRKRLTADEFAGYMRALGMEAADGERQSRH